eukprot:TRINITY_DN105131_c0_g1_i1.p1 TRINITY_DN105131_c0_g1~~TRINITY_DN105131_c0_g1_i1.p1  ORF type:complete len:190 (-),score=5.56 TRINITY_DN105131_c0_g1_i1:775-1344(-)
MVNTDLNKQQGVRKTPSTACNIYCLQNNSLQLQMNKTLIFSLLSLGMFSGSLLSGLLPVWITVKSSTIDSISLYGAGLMIGVSLVVVIPEAIRAMYMNSFTTLKADPECICFDTTTIDKTKKLESIDYADLENPNDGFFETHQIIGICLISGFILMVLVEQIFSIWSESREAKEQEYEIIPIDAKTINP